MAKFQIKYWIDDGDVRHEGEYITDEPKEFIEYAKKWYGAKIHFSKIKAIA